MFLPARGERERIATSARALVRLARAAGGKLVAGDDSGSCERPQPGNDEGAAGPASAAGLGRCEAAMRPR